MKKEHNYVTCQSCEWQLTNYPDRDWEQNPCSRCKNTRQVIDPREILCNLCGGCMCPIGTHNEQYPHGLVDVKVTGGYDSHHLFDLTTYIFSFCEECLRKLFNQCKIKPRLHDTNIGTGELGPEESWEQDQEYYEERVWQSSSAPHEAYLNKRCNTKKDCQNEAIYSLFHEDNDGHYSIFSEKTACEEHKNYYKNFMGSMLKPYIPPKLIPFL